MKEFFISAAAAFACFGLGWIVATGIHKRSAVQRQVATPDQQAEANVACTFFPGDKVTIIPRGWHGKVASTTFGQDSILVRYTDGDGERESGWFESGDLKLE